LASHGNMFWQSSRVYPHKEKKPPKHGYKW
jgi:hypothetical protein